MFLTNLNAFNYTKICIVICGATFLLYMYLYVWIWPCMCGTCPCMCGHGFVCVDMALHVWCMSLQMVHVLVCVDMALYVWYMSLYVWYMSLYVWTWLCMCGHGLLCVDMSTTHTMSCTTHKKTAPFCVGIIWIAWFYLFCCIKTKLISTCKHPCGHRTACVTLCCCDKSNIDMMRVGIFEVSLCLQYKSTTQQPFILIIMVLIISVCNGKVQISMSNASLGLVQRGTPRFCQFF